MKLHSTNRETSDVDFKTALIAGLAPDKGLYTPGEFHPFDRNALASLVDKDYPSLATEVLVQLIGDEIPRDVIRRICKQAYNFPVPIVKIGDAEPGTFILHLDKGPTASFKDFAARVMARFMHYLASQQGKELTILTATSGDTGGAVAAAFLGVKGIKVAVLFPSVEVSARQRRQMTTLGKNVTAIAIDGKFDDCQTLVKQAFSDPDLADLNLSSANSINVGRLLPQSVYYFWAYFRANEEKIAAGTWDPTVVSVPSGNFGDLMGGLIAKQLGLPIAKFIAAVNENDEFPKFLETGEYQKIEPSINCLSNAMNVGHPSNLARVVDLYGGTMNHEGTIIAQPDMDRMREDIYSASISDEETKFIIGTVFQKYHYVLEPHGAVGWGGLQRYREHDEQGAARVAVTIETADPAKFPEIVKEVTGVEPVVPKSLKAMENKAEKVLTLSREYAELQAYLRLKYGQ